MTSSRIKYGLVWLLSSMALSLFVQKMVMMLFGMSYALRTGKASEVDFIAGFFQAATAFWDPRRSWEAAGMLGVVSMALTCLFGLTAGLARRKTWLRALPRVFGALALVCVPVYALQVTYFGEVAFWSQIFWRTATLAAMLGCGLWLDRRLEERMFASSDVGATADLNAYKIKEVHRL